MQVVFDPVTQSNVFVPSDKRGARAAGASGAAAASAGAAAGAWDDIHGLADGGIVESEGSSSEEEDKVSALSAIDVSTRQVCPTSAKCVSLLRPALELFCVSLSPLCAPSSSPASLPRARGEREKRAAPAWVHFTVTMFANLAHSLTRSP